MKTKRLLALLMALTMLLTLTMPVLAVADGEEGAVGEEQQGEPTVCEHIWNEGEVTAEPTCRAEGVRTYTCTVCDETKTEPVEKLAHAWNEGEVTAEPTCQAEGVRTYTCTVCGETKTEPVEKTDHAWNEGEVTAEPTCRAEGIRTYTCTVCDETKTEPVEKLAHAFEGGVCTVCGEAAPVEPALGGAEPAPAPQTYEVTFTGLLEGVNVTVRVYAQRADGDYSEAEPLAYEAGLVPGEYHYIAAAEGYETAEDDFTVADRDVEIELALTAATVENEPEKGQPKDGALQMTKGSATWMGLVTEPDANVVASFTGDDGVTYYAYSVEEALWGAASQVPSSTVYLLKDWQEDVVLGERQYFRLNLNGKTLSGVESHESYTIVNRGTLDIMGSGNIKRGPNVKWINNLGTVHISGGYYEEQIPEVWCYSGIIPTTEAPYTVQPGWKVKFISQGSWWDKQYIKHNSTVQRPDDPVRTGWEFLGWFKEGEETAYDFDTPVTGDMVFEARWKKMWAVEFDTDGGSGVATQYIKQNSMDTVQKPDDPYKTGVAFGGWFKEGEETPYDFDTPVTGDMKLVARWGIAVAQVGLHSYATLQAAFDAVADSRWDSMVTVLRDCEADVLTIGQGYYLYDQTYLDLNGKDVTIGGLSFAAWSPDHNVLFHIKDGTVDLDTVSYDGTNFPGGTLRCTGPLMSDQGNTGTVMLSSGNIRCSVEEGYAAVSGSHSLRIYNGSFVVENGCVYNGDESFAIQGGYVEAGQEVVRQVGYASISGGMIKGGAAVEEGENGTGELPPDVVMGYDISISGGTFFSNPYDNLNQYFLKDTKYTAWEEENGWWTVEAHGVLTFDLNLGVYEGSTDPVKVLFRKNTSYIAAPLDPEPTREYFVFTDWYDGDTKFDFTTPIMDDLTLHAVWEPDPDAPVPPTTVFTGSLNLSDSIDLNLYADGIPDVTTVSGYYVKYSATSSDLTNGRRADFTEQNRVGEQKYRFSAVASFPANQMTRKVYFGLFNADDEQVESGSFSVQDYCQAVFRHTTDTDLYKLCEALLAYGHFAQDRFPGTSSDPVDETLCADAIEAVNSFDWWGDSSLKPYDMFGPVIQSYNEWDGPYFNHFSFFTYTDQYTDGARITASLSLQSKTELIFYFYGGYTAEDLSDLIVKVGEEVRSDIVVEKTYIGGDTPKWRVKLKGLTPLDMGKVVSLQDARRPITYNYYSTSYGAPDYYGYYWIDFITHFTYVVYAPLQYAVHVFDYGVETETNVCRALYLYCGAARKYFS